MSHATASGTHRASVRVATYNILSSKLARSDYFTHCKEEDLVPDVRFKRILEKLSAEIQKEAVICLQEVPMEWAGPLHTWLLQRGYHFVLTLYGGPFNGYMGIGIAFSTKKFSAEEIKLERLSDTKRWAFAPKPGLFKKTLGVVTSPVVGLWGLGEGIVRTVLRAPKAKPPVDEWMYSRGRQNTVAFVRLKCLKTGVVFGVSTYHMPCAFWAPKVMTIHTAMLGQYVRKVAKADPYVVCGDFNIKPGSLCYKLLTTGALDTSHPEFEAGNPVKPRFDSSDWSVAQSHKLKSAYVEALGREPDFTNNAQIKDQEPFVETLDYIFLSPQWQVADVLPLPHRTAVQGPFPTKDEPSDHLLVAATLSLSLPPIT